MKHIIIYTKSSCPYCHRAKTLLDSKHVKYEEIKIDNNQQLKAEMVKKSGGRITVPQIFIGDTHIGGCDDLYVLENDGKLDDLLA